MAASSIGSDTCAATMPCCMPTPMASKGPTALSMPKTAETSGVNMARFSSYVENAMMISAPEKMPAAPTLATARPAMRVVELGATPQQTGRRVRPFHAATLVKASKEQLEGAQSEQVCRPLQANVVERVEQIGDHGDGRGDDCVVKGDVQDVEFSGQHYVGKLEPAGILVPAFLDSVELLTRRCQHRRRGK